MKKISVLLSAVIALFMGATSAHADLRDVYTISNIPVDHTANTTREAEAQAVAEAKIIGLYRLIERLTLEEDRALLGEDFYSYSNANELAAAVDVDNERRSTTVYRAELSVVYNPIRLRAQLSQRGVPFIDQQASRVLLVPVSASAAPVAEWASVWPRSDEGALSPYTTSQRPRSSVADWSAVAPEVRSVGATGAIFAGLVGTDGDYAVNLTRMTAAGQTVIGRTRSVATLEEAVAAASAYMDAAWKSQSIVRSDEARTDSTAVARFSDQRSWNAMRSAMSNSPLISGFRVDAIARDGALVSFTYAGSEERLRTEFSQRGINLSSSPDGWVIEYGGGRRF
ncbi:MAG TPA: hypothetical protein DDZ43_10895 [Hyphomonadaceae bacterium]|nr:hypothetical protein [Hyphomonadaceae bacterium]